MQGFFVVFWCAATYMVARQKGGSAMKHPFDDVSEEAHTSGIVQNPITGEGDALPNDDDKLWHLMMEDPFGIFPPPSPRVKLPVAKGTKGKPADSSKSLAGKPIAFDGM